MLLGALKARVELSPDGQEPFAVIFHNDDCELERTLVSTREEGEALIARVLATIAPGNPPGLPRSLS